MADSVFTNFYITIEYMIFYDSQSKTCPQFFLSGTPVVAIQYEPKTKDMMDSFGLGDWVIDIEQINPERLVQMVDQGTENRDSIKNQIAQKLPELKAKSKDNTRLVHELLVGEIGRS